VPHTPKSRSPNHIRTKLTSFLGVITFSELETDLFN
jgi:hypothetical protein